MADILKIFLLIVGAMLMFVASWIAIQALFPQFVSRARSNYSRPVRTFGLGVLCTIPFLLLTLWLFKNSRNPVMNILGVISIGFPVLLGLAGSTGLAQRIGAGLPTPLDNQQPWRRTLRGGIVLALTFLLPFLGWIGLTLFTLLSGFGSAILAIRSRPRTEPPPSLATNPASRPA